MTVWKTSEIIRVNVFVDETAKWKGADPTFVEVY